MVISDYVDSEPPINLARVYKEIITISQNLLERMHAYVIDKFFAPLKNTDSSDFEDTPQPSKSELR